MAADRIERRSFALPLRCNYLLREPQRRGDGTLLILLLHGHAMTPEQMLKLSAPLFGEGHVLASLQGPYQLWVREAGNARSDVAFHWSTRFEAEHSRRLHHDMILRVIAEAGMPAARTVLVGFSQTVSLNYRFVCTHTDAVRGVIGICGGIPGDWDEAAYAATETAALHIATREDEFYLPAVTAPYAERLRRYVGDVEYHLLEGGHRIPSAARPIVQAWLERVAGPPGTGSSPAGSP